MLSHVLRKAGYKVGLACTDGVYVDDKLIKAFDYSGYKGAKLAFKQSEISAAVLETARGGLISSGLYTRACHVAALLNIQHEQIGIDGINSLEEMALHKRQVTDAARDRVILNFDDDLCRQIASNYNPSKLTFFSIRLRDSRIEEWLAAGSKACVIDDTGEWLVIVSPDQASCKIARINDIPATMGGLLEHNVQNALAVAALASGLGVGSDAIREGLNAFENTPEMSPGRFNIIHEYPFRIVLDRAISPPSLTRSIEAFMKLPVQGRRYCMISAVGNRPDDTYNQMAEIVAGKFELYFCFETDYFRRSRQPGEIARRLGSGLKTYGVRDDQIICLATPQEAVTRLFASCSARDVAFVNMLSPKELQSNL